MSARRPVAIGGPGARVLCDHRRGMRTAHNFVLVIWPRALVLAIATVALTGCPSSPNADAGDAMDAELPDTILAPDVPADMFRLPDGPPPRLPDDRQACAARNPLRQPYFGDLHVHTTMSFDAVVAGTRLRPRDAYDFARGRPVALPPYDAAGGGGRRSQLDRPLDFAAVTDHGEFLGEIRMCLDPASPGYLDGVCVRLRETPLGTDLFAELGLSLTQPNPMRVRFCQRQPGECLRELRDAWQETQDAAESAYDRTSACQFTSFVGYEWTGTTGASNLHRNVLFRTRQVPWTPVSYYEANTPQRLWSQLDTLCLRAGFGCDVLAIPHNSNLGGGTIFVPRADDAMPYDRAQAEQRARMEPLVEIYQHKGASECLVGWPSPLGPADEQCRFEALPSAICTGRPTDPPDCSPLCGPGVVGGFGSVCPSPNDYVRGALTLGLQERARLGANPFEFGLIGSTDTHNGTPGNVSERTFPGHMAMVDDQPVEQMTGRPGRFSPGGLAVIWADENSRDALFDALRRRETYATSGTRPIVRFFGGWSYAIDLCTVPDLVSQGYAHGVPMGGVLPMRASMTSSPRFVVQAFRDPGSTPDAGAQLAVAQVVKGWLDATGPHERVYDVVGNLNNGAGVDPATCALTGTGSDSLCTVWTDPDFHADEAAFYYVRVIENPTCRWSTRVCTAARVDCTTLPATDPFAQCCHPRLPRDIRERAWTSPIWYYP